jgi:hypothetical protein
VIRQIATPVRFTNATRIAVPLRAQSLEQTTIVLAVSVNGRTCAMRVSDNTTAPRWRQANFDGATARWYRVPGPQGGVTEITIETANAIKLSGMAIAAEFVGCSSGECVQQLDDLLAEVA